MLNLSKHALQRAAQRNLRDVDLDIILTLGSEVVDSYLMRDADCLAAERELKRALQHVRRLRGKRLVVKDGTIITAFHASDREVRRVLRRSEERSLTTCQK